jgi:transcription antitermination factor NusG
MPTFTERHRWSDRWKNVVLPLFPGYLFARGETGQLHRLLRTPGVLTVVKTGDKPTLLTDSFIASLREALDRATAVAKPVTERHDYSIDEEVVVQEGPLAGLRGVVRQFRGARHLVIWVQAIGRGVAFTIGAALVARATVRDDIYA